MTSIAPRWRQFLDTNGPHYTSYPTADRFVEAFTADDYACALRHRSQAQALRLPLALYVHVPFCESLCYFCACNQVITRHHQRGAQYLTYLGREIGLQRAHLGPGQSVSQLHLGGGTPTFFNDDELTRLMALLRDSFTLVPGGEYAIEVDPRTVDAARLATLTRLGFNRISLGVQDFDPEVQKAVHRIQPAQQVVALVDQARRMGVESINLDLIYGLPRQTRASFARTLDQVCALQPDRIALYGYSHRPERFKPQRRIEPSELPAAADKLGMFTGALEPLEAAGYVYIGMDQFALPSDAWAVAKRQGRLYRSIQGYSTQPECDRVALGVSSIGRVGATYSQNAKTLEEYYDLIDHGRLPVTRGLALTRDDLARRAVIMALVCQGQVQFESIELAWLLNFRSYFAAEIARLEPLAEQGLVTVDHQGIEVTAQGRYCVRAVARVFDRHLQADRQRAQFSRIL